MMQADFVQLLKGNEAPFCFTGRDYSFLIAKIPCESHGSLILGNQAGKGSSFGAHHSTYLKLRYLGLFSSHTEELIDLDDTLCYALGLEKTSLRSKDQLDREMSHRVNEAVKALVQADPSGFSPEDSGRYYMQDLAENLAYVSFYSRQVKDRPLYIPTCHPLAANLEYLAAPEQTVVSLAETYAHVRMEDIRQNLGVQRKVREILQCLEKDTAGEHHIRRAIAEACKDKRTVHVTIMRDGKPILFRAIANLIGRPDEDSFRCSAVHADNRARVYEYIGTNGFTPRDIVQIQHKNQVIYTSPSRHE